MIKMLMLRVKDKREQRFTTKNTEKTQSKKKKPLLYLLSLL
jgi:hypothetical protein